MPWGDRDLENRDLDSAFFAIVVDGERVKEGIIEFDWLVVVFAVKRQITEFILTGEVDQHGDPGTGAQWGER